MSLFSSNQKPSTQSHLEIAEIRDSIVVTKDGSLKMVFLCSAVNFDLKSEEEQEIIIHRYQNFLNSLTFPIQILVQSRPVNLGNYLNKLRELTKKQTNPLLKIQMEGYIVFLQELIATANILDKRFYVVVSYTPPIIKTPTLGGVRSSTHKTYSDQEFENYKRQLLERGNLIATGLASVGLRCIQLNTQELIDLFYTTYNPELANTEKLLPVEELNTEVIQRGAKSNV